MRNSLSQLPRFCKENGKMAEQVPIHSSCRWFHPETLHSQSQRRQDTGGTRSVLQGLDQRDEPRWGHHLWTLKNLNIKQNWAQINSDRQIVLLFYVQVVLFKTRRTFTNYREVCSFQKLGCPSWYHADVNSCIIYMEGLNTQSQCPALCCGVETITFISRWFSKEFR